MEQIDDVEPQPSATHHRLCPCNFNVASSLQAEPCSLRKIMGALITIVLIVLALFENSYSFVLPKLATSTKQLCFAFTRRLGGHKSVRALPSTNVEKESDNLSHASSNSPLPWINSIKATRNLTYMPMLTHHMGVMKDLGMTEVPIEEEFSYQSSKTRPARIASLCFQNDKFRKVRFTYFDAGDAVQVFNAVWYPAYQYDIPILGMDFISIGNSNSHRVINVMDFQPLHATPEYTAKYIDPLTSIRSKYPELHDTLSGKIYHDAQFFSKNMLFGRLPDETKVSTVVFPAYTEYMNAYTACMAKAVPDFSPQSMAAVEARQSAYDAYNTVKDPAVGIYNAYFGKDWSHRFVHDFLFDKCREGEYTPSAEEVSKGLSATTGCGSGTSINSVNSIDGSASKHDTVKSSCMSAPPTHAFKIDDQTGDISFLPPRT